MPPDDAPDWSACIVAIARSRDKKQFAALFAHFAPRLKGFLMKLGTVTGTAEDLAQDTMLTVWRKAHLFDPARASAATWIFTIARNLRLDQLRRTRDPRQLVDVQSDVDESLPSDRLLSAQFEAMVTTALGKLSEEQASVIRLSFFEDRPHAEIARALQIPLGTVKSRLRLAMNRLRTLVEEHP